MKNTASTMKPKSDEIVLIVQVSHRENGEHHKSDALLNGLQLSRCELIRAPSDLQAPEKHWLPKSFLIRRSTQSATYFLSRDHLRSTGTVAVATAFFMTTAG
jgi:hypothetical protein